MLPISVGVLRGGPSSEYEVSLNTGREVLNNLNTNKYNPIDIFIDQSGYWYMNGLVVSPMQVARQVDVFLNALHGEYGEDGTIQNILENTKVPYTGSKHFASALAMNKPMSKDFLKQYNIKQPGHMVVQTGDSIDDLAKIIFNKFAPPWVVKPANKGSSVGLFLVYSVTELSEAIGKCLNLSDRVIVEEFISGKEATCGVIESFRDREIYSLPPIEIRKPKAKKLFDYEAKYSGETVEVCPGSFSSEEKLEIEKIAKLVHQTLGLRHYSRTDFIVNKRGIYLLETNTLPGLTKESLLPKALKAVGCSYSDFLDHIITLALKD